MSAADGPGTDHLASEVLENLREGVQLIGPGFTYLYVNAAAARHGRSTPEALVGRTMMESYPGIDRTPFFARLRECMANGAPAQLENEFQFPDGQKGWFELRLQPGPQGVLVLSIDISERKRIDGALQRSRRALTALSAMNQALVRAEDELTFMQEVCNIAVDKGGYRMSWIGEKVHDAARSIRALAACGLDQGYTAQLALSWDAASPRGLGPTGRAMRTGEVVIARAIANDPDFEPWRRAATARGFASWIALPFRVAGEVAGAVSVYATEPDAFDEREVELLTEFALDLGHGVQTLRERRAAEASAARVMRLTAVLEGIRGVNRLITRERDPKALLTSAAQLLVSSHGFDACCIGTCEGRRLTLVAEAGDERRRKALSSLLGACDLVARPRREQDGDEALCDDQGDVIAVRIESSDTVHGAIFVALPGGLRAGEQETSLLREAADDLALALRGIQSEQERRHAEQEVSAGDERWNAFMTATPAIAWVKDADGRFVYVNQTMERVFQRPREAWLGRGLLELLPPETAARLDAADQRLRETDLPQEQIEDVGDLGGRHSHWSTVRFQFRSASGQRLLGGIGIDVTDRLHAEEQERLLNERLERLTKVVRDLSAARDLAGVAEIVRTAARALTGADGATFVLRDGDQCHYVDEDAVAPLWKGRRFLLSSCVSGWVMAHGEATAIPDVYADPRVPHDAYRPTFVKSLAMVPIRSGEPLGAIGIYWSSPHTCSTDELRILQALADSTSIALERVHSLRQLERSEDRYRTLVENLEDVVFSTDVEGRLLYVSPSVGKYGYTQEEMLGQSFATFVHPDELSGLAESLVRALAGHVETRVFRALDKAGREHVVRTASRAVVHDGRLVGVSGVLIDITELKRTEDQLRVAQKMEAVGQLAGGIAHDFNNLLAVILSYAGFVSDAAKGQEGLLADVEEIRKAGMRAAALTRQLLAFSRKQVLQPQVLDLNRTADELDRMLRRLIGEDIDLELCLAPELGRVRADPGQIEQVLMNLVVNARDAMPHGGKLTIETANVDVDDDLTGSHVGHRRGPFVVLSVRDTGIGMDRATQERIFEPFFTTKETGKGTGLGLSTVYGIVEQSGGTIRVRSEPNVGTTFEIFLPRLADDAAEPSARRDSERPAVGSENILLVEDDDAVRSLAARILRRAGYTVWSAANGGEALMTCEAHPGDIGLLVTDVVMPQMSGRQLAERLLQLQPDMRVLYMSGYTDTTIQQHGVLDPDTLFLSKPFTATTLARKVREALDGTPAPHLPRDDMA